MNRFCWRALLVVCLLAAWGSSVRADDPARGRHGATTSRTSPPLRLQVVLRNLWDVLWNNPAVPTVTGRTHLNWKWLAARYDTDRDGFVSRDEFPGSSDGFARLDRNWDGQLTQEDLDWSPKGLLGRQKATT